MEFETKSSEQIEIDILKSKLETVEAQIQFLEKNWIYWTKSTQNIGQKLIVALDEIQKKNT